MKKKVILLVLLLIVLAALFIPVSQQRSETIKASFFNTYQQLGAAGNWQKWRSDLRKTWLTDSSKISIRKDQNDFTLAYNDLTIQVKPVNGYSFSVTEQTEYGSLDYGFTLIPAKNPDEAMLSVTQRTSLIHYLFGGEDLSATHAADLKRFMESPDLYYGFHIIKMHVTDTALVVTGKTVPGKDKFTEAAKLLDELRQYIAKNGLRQTQPLIAQFLPGRRDSIRLKIGIPVNKKAHSEAPFSYMTMPSSGYFYTTVFRGKFSDRQKAYAAIYHYFKDRTMQVPILPFDTYLDNKLPASDTDRVNIRVNFSTF